MTTEPGKIYLAGPINDCTDSEAIDWRYLVKRNIGEERCIDPMRRDYRGREDQCTAELVEADKEDIQSSGTVLANCWQPSWGTAMEILYAWEQGKRVIVIVQPGTRPSPWLLYHSTVVTSLQDALVLFGVLRVEAAG